jgi:hypothetical protein
VGGRVSDRERWSDTHPEVSCENFSESKSVKRAQLDGLLNKCLRFR